MIWRAFSISRRQSLGVFDEPKNYAQDSNSGLSSNASGSGRDIASDNYTGGFAGGTLREGGSGTTKVGRNSQPFARTRRSHGTCCPARISAHHREDEDVAR